MTNPQDPLTLFADDGSRRVRVSQDVSPGDAPSVDPGDAVRSSPGDAVRIYEVSPRDGLQNEATIVSMENKLALLQLLLPAGLHRIEATSFVSPKWIPQLADADELSARLMRGAEFASGSRELLTALCPNMRGLERAMASGLTEVAVFLSASESHNRKNLGRPIAESLAELSDTVARARGASMRVRAYVSTVWGCPYEGEVPVAQTLQIVRSLLAMGCYEISLGDTIGVGNPRQTAHLLDAILSEVPVDRIAMHMHDTRGTALANVCVGLDKGVRVFDGSVGGLGGCPYAPGAAGNLATEDLVDMLHAMGLQTGVDLDRLIEAARLSSQFLGRDLPGKVHRAGRFHPLGSP